jgi:DNA-binding MarR family transcriptional regulator
VRPGKLAASVWVRLAKCYGLALKGIQARGSTDPLTIPQFDVVSQLLRNPGGMTPGALSRALLVTAGNVTGIVARLEAQHLVERTDHPSDGRAQLIRLTREGRRKGLAAVARHERRISDVFGGLPEDQQVRVRDALEDLRQALEPRPAHTLRRSA